MRSNPKILVVGTTSDYIDWIRQQRPGQALFITEPAVRQQACEPRPAAKEEILCPLSNEQGVRQALARHLADHKIALKGVTSYDCESMELAAVLADEYGLPYPLRQAVENCRDKHRAKSMWQEAWLCTPRQKQVKSARQAADFFKALNGPLVLKPPCGSGSELVFRCDSVDACEENFRKIIDGLKLRRGLPLYHTFDPDDPAILAEEFVSGNEYSCDFVLENGRVEIIRLAAKILSAKDPLGTVLAYLLPAPWPGEIDRGSLQQTLYKSAAVLGISRAVCMADFIVDRGRIVLLELTPRPGGDCLPALLRLARKLDPLILLLDFACRRSLKTGLPNGAQPMGALRIFGRKNGILKRIDTRRLSKDPCVHEICLTRRPGHRITLPPEDYDSWYLGHVIFEPNGGEPVDRQCRRLLEKVDLTIGGL